MSKYLYAVFMFLLIIRAISQLTLGPAKVTFDEITECENPESYHNRLKAAFKNVNQSFYNLDFDTDFQKDVDSSIDMDITISREIYSITIPKYVKLITKDVCAFGFKHAGPTLKSILKKIEKLQECPVDSGVYHVEDVEIDLSRIPKILPYGNFTATLYWVQKKEKILCQKIYAKIIQDSKM